MHERLSDLSTKIEEAHQRLRAIRSLATVLFDLTNRTTTELDGRIEDVAYILEDVLTGQVERSGVILGECAAIARSTSADDCTKQEDPTL